jgi:hypothetical protein
MDYSKELLLFVATTLVSVGATQIASDIVLGVILLLLGAMVFVGRGFYKKYLEKEKEKTNEEDN